MKTREEIDEILSTIQATSSRTLQFDEEAIYAEYQRDKDDQSLSIKIMTILGGILACISFVGFILIAGLYDSEMGMLLFGGICLVASLLVSKSSDKIILDTIGISAFIIGFVLIGIGLSGMDVDKNLIILSILLTSLATFSLSRNYILTFLSTLVINGSILFFCILNDEVVLVQAYLSLLAAGIAFIFLNEAKCLAASPAISKRYEPVRIASLFSIICVSLFLSINGLEEIAQKYIIASSVFIIIVILYVMSIVLKKLSINDQSGKLTIYGLTILLLLPTLLYPAISGAFLMILLSFMVSYRTGFFLGIISFIYFIGQYYYDLNFTLLTKSILLFCSGILFLLLYYFTSKKSSKNG
ncbi:DUF4401 domain-containing protein [Sphingobacterium hungaricum]|uniref:DUF4401 domain-containing protein n=1 Tax=Sphingobacterium hungaricum TaxID=2082723 RepID=A0A928V189_9SPHI|nr:DUF4401 domain-containing protein [Sphingobacterium hungaricum]MBE8715131.1 DUF4401 domain-containing protein [Sphingobacterium hungaricum]